METLTREKIISALATAARRDLSSGTHRESLMRSLSRVVDKDILEEVKKRI